MRRLADLLLVLISAVAVLLFLGSVRAVEIANQESDRLRIQLGEESARADAAKTEALFWRGIAARLGASPAPTIATPAPLPLAPISRPRPHRLL